MLAGPFVSQRQAASRHGHWLELVTWPSLPQGKLGNAEARGHLDTGLLTPCPCLLFK